VSAKYAHESAGIAAIAPSAYAAASDCPLMTGIIGMPASL
jgi:hypothetical protein